MYSTRRWKISACRASSHTWRAMSSWNSHGASGKSNSVRPAASIAWNSPAQIPCRRVLRKFSSSGIALNGVIPCWRRASRILSWGSRMWSSGRASLSTGIILCMAFASPSFGPRRPYAGQVDRFSDGPSVALRSDSELKREGRGRGSRQACLDEIMLHDPGFSQHLRIAVDPGFYRCGDLRDALAHVIASASSFLPAISAARNASTAASIAGGCGLIGPSGCGPITLARFPRSGIGEAPAFAAVVGDVAPWRALGGDILHARDHPSPLRFLPSKQQRHRGAIGMIKPDLGDEVGADTRAGQRLIARDGAAGAELARRGAPSFHRAREHEGLGGAI